MVCEKCEKKLSKIVTPDKWKDGARNTTDGGGRKVGENKLLTSAKKSRFAPYGGSSGSGSAGARFENCKICKQKVHQAGSHYCQPCAYSKGICAMCGVKLIKTKDYKQSST